MRDLRLPSCFLSVDFCGLGADIVKTVISLPIIKGFRCAIYQMKGVCFSHSCNVHKDGIRLNMNLNPIFPLLYLNQDFLFTIISQLVIYIERDLCKR